MVVSVSIKHDLDRLQRDLTKDQKLLTMKAIPQAINRTTKTVAGRAVRHISSVTSEKQKDIRSKMRVRKANRKHWDGVVDLREATASNLIKFVREAQRTPQTFRVRTKSGFKHPGVKARAWGKLKHYRGTFIGRGKNSGAMLVFRREGRKAVAVYGPSARQTFIKQDTIALLRRVTAERFPIEADAAIRNALRRG